LPGLDVDEDDLGEKGGGWLMMDSEANLKSIRRRATLGRLIRAGLGASGIRNSVCVLTGCWSLGMLAASRVSGDGCLTKPQLVNFSMSSRWDLRGDWGGRHWHGSATVVKGRTVLVAFSVAADHGRDPGPEPGKTGFRWAWWAWWAWWVLVWLWAIWHRARPP